jgi:hypothetical protein
VVEVLLVVVVEQVQLVVLVVEEVRIMEQEEQVIALLLVLHKEIQVEVVIKTQGILAVVNTVLEVEAVLLR